MDQHHHAVLDRARAEGRLVRLHRTLPGADRLEGFVLGTVTGLRPRSLRLHEVDTEARWYPEPTKYRLRDVTRVGLGDHYTSVLREFAGPRPDRDGTEAGSPV
ncbi:hypothetical protein ACWDD9_16775 [Kitasatospora sp. NPDC001119]